MITIDNNYGDFEATLISPDKESEDERIRKGLVSHLKELRNWEVGTLSPIKTPEHYDAWLAYLEKQKELPTNEEMLRTLRVEYEKGVADTIAKCEQKEQQPAHTAKEMWKKMRFEVLAQASGNIHEPYYADDSTKMFSLCDIDEIFEKIGNENGELKID